MKTKTQSHPALTLKTLGIFALLATLLLAGCVVTSVYPFYNAKDVTFDPALVGTWLDATKTNTDAETWTFEKLDDQTYKLIVMDSDKKTEFDTHLFKLDRQLFLDCLVRERPDGGVPTHLLMRVTSSAPKLELQLLDYGWLGKLLEQQPRAIRHIVVPKKAGDGDGGEFVLTADTAELQKFIRKHLKTKEAWAGGVSLKKK